MILLDPLFGENRVVVRMGVIVRTGVIVCVGIIVCVVVVMVVAWTGITVDGVQVNLFLSVDTRIWKRSRGPSIFPFDVRRTIEIDFFLYSCRCKSRLRNSVTPVRRREDTEGDGDAGVEVQIGCPSGVFSRMPSELLRNNSKD
ncbi:hypothetical protein BDV25DRAFT_26117 [Aspergillus avenaceus]|uniref:Transmembrane protein n=1 Tax=Aspergillus avenaceus TaxID=36643 RepID=A0A5N6TNJ9_ASPAV|nr:hypothetical protein BDV25DRAFT_26117 [Aspergillus avenaceus]